MRRVVLVAVLVAVTGCASQSPPVVYPSRQGVYGASRYPQQQDPLRKGAQDANSVESIVSSAARIARLFGGRGY